MISLKPSLVGGPTQRAAARAKLIEATRIALLKNPSKMMYQVWEHHTLTGLEVLVRAAIDNGFTPLGGVSVACNTNTQSVHYVQAMTKGGK